MLSTNVDQLANNTVKVIYALLDPLLEALATDKFDKEAFLSIDRRQQKILDYNDYLVNCAFISWDDFDLWNAWLRVFGLGTFLAEFHLMNKDTFIAWWRRLAVVCVLG